MFFYLFTCTNSNNNWYNHISYKIATLAVICFLNYRPSGFPNVINAYGCPYKNFARANVKQWFVSINPFYK